MSIIYIFSDFNDSWNNEIKKIFGEDKINESKLIEFLLKFNYTKYTKGRNLKIGGSINA